ncbi:MAG: RpoL/Rpb11 RNA polymerase subunit family protein [Candidatus Nitrosocaldaceae archaeon]
MDMEISIVNMSENRLTLNITEEDISLLYILQHELLNDKSVKFAGFSLKHPLKIEYTFNIVADDPLKAFENAIKAALDNTKELEELIKNKVKQ